MAYTMGIVRGSSIAMILFSILLLSFYIGCTNSCRFAGVSFYSPVWTSIWGIVIGALGIQMSRLQAEKRWGGWFLGLCILSVFISFGCLILSLTAFFFELLSTDSLITTYRFPPTTPSSPQIVSSPGNKDVAGVLWLCMMGTSFAIMIISIVSSCMFCCCQESSPPTRTETHVVLANGAIPPGQTIIVNNQEFILQPITPGGQTAIITGVPAALQDQPPPYSSIVDVNKPGNTGANITGVPYSQNQPVNPPATNIPGVPAANAPGHQYMELQRNVQNQQEYLQPASAPPPQEYTYVDDTLRDRERILTPDEIYDEVGLPERPSPNDTNSQTYTYASSEDRTAPSQSSAGRSDTDNTSGQNRSSPYGADPSYSYADNNTSSQIIHQTVSAANTPYANDGVVRAPRNEQLPPVPGEEDYLDILP